MLRLQLSQMEVDLPSIPLSIRPKYTSTFKAHKASLDRQRKLLKELKSAANRADLLGASSSGGGIDPSRRDDPYSDDASAGAYSQRTRLLQGNERLTDGAPFLFCSAVCRSGERAALMADGWVGHRHATPGGVAPDSARDRGHRSWHPFQPPWSARADRALARRRTFLFLRHSPALCPLALTRGDGLRGDQLQQADSSIDRASGTLKQMIFRCVLPSARPRGEFADRAKVEMVPVRVACTSSGSSRGVSSPSWVSGPVVLAVKMLGPD